MLVQGQRRQRSGWNAKRIPYRSTGLRRVVGTSVLPGLKPLSGAITDAREMVQGCTCDIAYGLIIEHFHSFSKQRILDSFQKVIGGPVERVLGLRRVAGGGDEEFHAPDLRPRRRSASAAAAARRTA